MHTLLATGEECHSWIIKCFYMGMQKNFSGLIPICRERHFEFNPCTAEPGYWQTHVDYISTINVSILLCEEPSAAAILFDVNYFIYPLNSSNVLPIVLGLFNVYTLKYETIIIKINADNTVVIKEFIYKHSLRNNLFYMYVDQHHSKYVYIA